MIITSLCGGLGNQMFQYAAGLALAYRRRTLLKLDVSWFNEYSAQPGHAYYGLNSFNILEQLATQDEITQIIGRPLSPIERKAIPLARALGFHDWVNRATPIGSLHAIRSFNFYPDFFELPDNTLIRGWWQSEKFFAPVADIIRQHFSFRFPALPAVAEMADRIRSGPSAAIHFRRGDYLVAHRKDFGVPGPDYYAQAIKLIRARSPEATLYIFSDDIEGVAREFSPPGPHVFVRCVGERHPWDAIRLMSLCNHFVIANSSFSWWGAWLNPSPTKLVIGPDPWYLNREHNTTDVIPEAWSRLPIHQSG